MSHNPANTTYFISLHFAPKTNKIIPDAVDSIAQITGNRYTTENRIPPHMTIGAFRGTKKKVENLD